MSAREFVVEAGFAAARAACEVLKEQGCSRKALKVMEQLDKAAVELFQLAKQLPVKRE